MSSVLLNVTFLDLHLRLKRRDRHTFYSHLILDNNPLIFKVSGNWIKNVTKPLKKCLSPPALWYNLLNTYFNTIWISVSATAGKDEKNEPSHGSA